MADIRPRAEAALDEFWELAMGRLRDSIGAEKIYKARCPNPKCGREVSVKYPDLAAVNASLKILLEHGHGRPTEAPKPSSGPSDEVDWAALSDEELERYARGGS